MSRVLRSAADDRFARVDPLRTAIAFAVLFGGAAIAWSFFDGLTLALAALAATAALPAWLRARANDPTEPSVAAWSLAYALVVAAALTFLLVPQLGAVERLRGLLLGLSTVPLGWVARGGPRPLPESS